MNTETMPTGSRSDVSDVDGSEVDNLDFEPEGDFLPEDIGPPPDIVVFDVGEVLIDETRVWGIWADILGVSRFTFAAVLGAAISQGLDHQAVFPVVAPNSDWMLFEEEHERRYGGFAEQDLYPDVRLCLGELRSMGVRIVIAGNQPQRRREQLLLLDLPCDHLATSDDLGAEKPELAFWDAVMQLCGASSPGQVLYVGDRVDNDILPAADYGMRTCWLRRGPWGRLQELPDDFEADLELDGLGELPLLLAGWRAQE
jgi:FMN phosphatase YigB (HAD superfamily)